VPRSSLLFDLFAANQQVKSLLTRAMASAGLRPDEYAVYSGVFEFGPISPTQLARVVGMPPTTLSHYVKAMREAGHVVEKRRPEDGRSRALTLSPSGLAAHRRANRAFEPAYQAFVSRVCDESVIKSALEGIEAAARDATRELSGKG
jgi:DNA-binding MarR family transcriptional regulator